MGRVYAARLYGGKMPEEEVDLFLCEKYGCTPAELYEQDDATIARHLAVITGRQQADDMKRRK